MAYQAERVQQIIKSGCAGDLTPDSEQFVLSLPDNGANMASIYPDSAHAWRGLDLQYPRFYRLEEAASFYEKQIDDIACEVVAAEARRNEQTCIPPADNNSPTPETDVCIP
jgi:hypothetical protein